MADVRIKDLNREVTDFSNGDFIVVDGNIGSSKMAKDSLLKVTAQNALAGNVAPAFDPTRTSENPYNEGESVLYTDGKVYTFKVDHYGAWNASDVEENPYLSLKIMEVALDVQDIAAPNFKPFEFTRISNKYLKPDGSVTDLERDSYYYITGYLDVSGKRRVRVSGSTNFNNVVCCFYNPDYSVNKIAIKNPGSGSTVTNYDNIVLEVPSGAKYMVVAKIGGSAIGAEYQDGLILANEAELKTLESNVEEIAEGLSNISVEDWKGFSFTEEFQKFILSDGSIRDYTNGQYFAITSYIDVEGKRKVKVSGSANFGHAVCVFYNSDYSVNQIALKATSTTSTIDSFDNVELNVPIGAKYMLIARATYTSYKPIKAIYFDKLVPVNQEQLDLTEDKVDDITEEKFSSFAISYIQNHFVTGAGVITTYENSHYYITDYIDVEGKTRVKVSGAAGFGNAVCVFYNSDYSVNKVALKDTQGGSGWREFTNLELDVPGTAKYMVLAGTNEGGRALPTGSYFAKYIVKKVWEGRKWCCVGDSLTERNIRTTKNYADYISEETGIEIVNMGVSGTGYKRQYENNNAFYQRISSVPLDADVVTIFGSGNDQSYFGVDDMGTATDTGTTTLGGCINTTIDNLYARLPAVHLGIVAPCPWGGYNPANHTNGMARYTELLKEICFNRSIPFLDLYHESNLRPWDSNFLPIAYSKDNGNRVHPDETGHKLLAGRFKVFVESIM